MNGSAQSRAWHLTINNPCDYGFTHDSIIDKLQRSNPRYFCFSDEIAATGTPHTHVYAKFNSPVRFATLKARFPIAHIEPARGSASENRDYIRKEGKWADSNKSETSIPGTFFEFGELPTVAEENSPKMFQLLQDVEDGHTTSEIIRAKPGFAFHTKDIDTIRDILMLEPFLSKNRALTVYYLFGKPGTGKTRSIYEQYPPESIFRITDYGMKNGLRFDGYHGQDVVIFEEFASQVPIESMLNYLDIYPLYLPARYYDRIAAYSKVFITSNLPLEKQYLDEQRYKPDTWAAFLRRITKIIEFPQKQAPNQFEGIETEVNPIDERR